MTRALAANGHIAIGTLDETAIQALGGDLEDALIGVQEVSVRREGDLLHFSACGEVSADDDLPKELQRIAEQHGVTFVALIHEDGEACDVHFFGADAETVQALMTEYRGWAAANAFPSVGSE